MATYMVNILDTNRWGGPFSHLWEVQEYVIDNEYDPDEWEFTGRCRDRTYFNHEKAKQKVDNREYDVPCGERAFTEDETDTYTFYDEERGVFEVNVVATCVECGFKHEDTSLLHPKP